jgi:peptidoglycan/LPS O-acetylase OafA/YrhL
VGRGLQHHQAALVTGLRNARGLRREVRCNRLARYAPPGLRMPTCCSTRPTGHTTGRDYKRCWMKVQWQVRRLEFLGILRLFLALSVIAGHSSSTVFGFSGVGAFQAVQCFFVISGFYMAMVLNGKYRETAPSVFYANRARRLLPTYYIGIILALAVSWQTVLSDFMNLSVPLRVMFLVQNSFIFGQDLSYIICNPVGAGCASPIALTLNPPTWSIAAELVFYCVAPFLLKGIGRTFLLFSAGLIYHFLLNGIPFPLYTIDLFQPLTRDSLAYFLYGSSFMFFGAGALSYHLSKDSKLSYYFVGLPALVALSYVNPPLPSWQLLLFALSVPLIFQITARNRVDRFIGELSYPVYIVHFPLLLLLRQLDASLLESWRIATIGTVLAVSSCAVGLVIQLVLNQMFDVNGRTAEKTRGTGSAGLGLSLSAIVISLPIAFLLWLILAAPVSVTAYNLTDPNWINGVSRQGAMFFVDSTMLNRRVLEVGSSVTFKDGERRRIVGTTTNGAYLNVTVEGRSLNPLVAGYPNRISVGE